MLVAMYVLFHLILLITLSINSITLPLHMTYNKIKAQKGLSNQEKNHILSKFKPRIVKLQS